jgi:transcription-repair coupling factor (superfamily II helicase)
LLRYLVEIPKKVQNGVRGVNLAQAIETENLPIGRFLNEFLGSLPNASDSPRPFLQSDPFRISGLASSRDTELASSLYFLSQLLSKTDESSGPILCVLPAKSDLDESAETLRALLEVDDPRLTVLTFPSWEGSPYLPVALSILVRHKRIGTLNTVSGVRARGGALGKTVILTHLDALFRKTLSWKTHNRYCHLLREGEEIESREWLVSQLIAAGYHRTDPVEDPGTFSVRGEIIDVFPPGETLPTRIELFGETIEKLRVFDPKTQRTLTQKSPNNKSVLFLGPSREILINGESTSNLKSQIKVFSDEEGIHRSIRDPLVDSIVPGTYSDHSDSWASFVYRPDDTRSGLELFLELGSSVIAHDPISILQSWDDYLDQQKKLSLDYRQNPHTIIPKPDQLFGICKTDTEPTDFFLREVRLRLDPLTLTEASEIPDNPKEDAFRNHWKTRVFSPAHSGTPSASEPEAALLEHWRSRILDAISAGTTVTITSPAQAELDRIRYLLSNDTNSDQMLNRVRYKNARLPSGFFWPEAGVLFVTDFEFFGRAAQRAKRRRSSTGGGVNSSKNTSGWGSWSNLQSLMDLSPGDLVVHLDHGIGKYVGLVRLALGGAPSDFLQLEYANLDKLYVPIYRLNVIQKHIGSGESAQLAKLGTQLFQREKERVRGEVKKIAIDLVKLYAERALREGVRFSNSDPEYDQFEESFDFEETPDQLQAIRAINDDLESGRPMDRLVCGDVGFGKTEVAMRAAFRAANQGSQVAVLVPTTLLAHQHAKNFQERFQNYPIRIEALTRFKPPKAQKQILTSLNEGKVDILIGTHRLLSKDVRFKKLGLIVVDEEHRFGVEHKEKLKVLKANTHVLTLTATPIPRTLHMALSGIRDISLISTPPVDRLPIRTFVAKYDEILIKQAIENELSRGGQVFFVHNRIQTIFEHAAQLREWVPRAQIVVAHGQMSETEIEKAMKAFYEKEANVLVCTAIIESGIDIPSANTLIVNRADQMGLAQLYQIRGRVGRGQTRGYAYLLIPSEQGLTSDAKKRLEVIQRFVELGSGFAIASHDLEIRGGGDLLGAAQSGNINAVGYEMFMDLLDEAVNELKGTRVSSEEKDAKEPEIKVPYAAFLPDSYVQDLHQRLALYRRFSSAEDEPTLQALEEEVRDRFGALPPEAHNLIALIRIKQLLKKFGIESLTVGAEKVSFSAGGPASLLDPLKAISLVASNPREYQLTPESKFVARITSTSMRDLAFELERLISRLASQKGAKKLPQ